MIALLQRVHSAQVTTELTEGHPKTLGAISEGLLVFIGIEPTDTPTLCQVVCDKIIRLRIFPDTMNTMNLSIDQPEQTLYGAPYNKAPLKVLIVSQFTLVANTRKGNRPGYNTAASPALGQTLYENFVSCFREALGDERIETGEFGANMKISLVNDGPTTFIIDKKAES